MIQIKDLTEDEKSRVYNIAGALKLSNINDEFSLYDLLDKIYLTTIYAQRNISDAIKILKEVK